MRLEMNVVSKYTDRLDAIKAGATTEMEIETAIAKKKEAAYAVGFRDFLQTGNVQNVLKEGSGGSGGYLVPMEYDKRLIEALKERNLLRKLGNVVNTEHDMIFARREDGLLGVWTAEGEPYTFGDMTFGQTELEAHKLVAGLLVTDELLADSGFDVETYIIKTLSETIGDMEEEAFFKGQGEHIPNGLIFQAHKAVTTENVGIISADDMVQLIYSVSKPYRENAVWVMSEDAVCKMRQIKTYNGRRAWTESDTEGEPDKFLGFKVYATKCLDEVMPGNRPVLFGDFKYFWIGDRGRRVIRRLNERFADLGQIGYMASQRVDAKLMQPEAVKSLEVKDA